jgi:predicted acyltransferase
MSGLLISTLALIKIGGKGFTSAAYSRVYQPIFGHYLGSFLFAISYCFIIWLIAYSLYKKKIFVKV